MPIHSLVEDEEDILRRNLDELRASCDVFRREKACGNRSDARTSTCLEQVEQDLDKLALFALTHFVDEEKLLKSLGKHLLDEANFTRHVEDHAHLGDKLLELLDLIADKVDATDLCMRVEEFARAVRNHLIQYDLPLLEQHR